MDPVSIIRTTVAVIAGIGINMLISKKLNKRDKQFKRIGAMVKDAGSGSSPEQNHAKLS